jgi:aspartate aminotransferase-like enzyme
MKRKVNSKNGGKSWQSTLASISCRFLVRRNVPDRVLRAMDMPTIDHRGPEFAQLGLDVLEGCRAVFRTENPVVIYPSSGTGAWEAAIVNTLSRGDKVLMAAAN